MKNILRLSILALASFPLHGADVGIQRTICYALKDRHIALALLQTGGRFKEFLAWSLLDADVPAPGAKAKSNFYSSEGERKREQLRKLRCPTDITPAWKSFEDIIAHYAEGDEARGLIVAAEILRQLTPQVVEEQPQARYAIDKPGVYRACR